MRIINDLGTLLPRYEESEERQSTVAQNVGTFKRIRGGLQMVRDHPVSFEPRTHYWHPPERRLLVAYFADEWHRRYAPAAALRAYAMRWFRHFRRGREDGRFASEGEPWMTVEYSLLGGWDAVAHEILDHAARFDDQGAFARLRAAWPRVEARDPVGHFNAFVERTLGADPGPGKVEPSFSKRLPWFSYLDASSEDELVERQHFFYGYANLMMSANAYRHAGAQTFAGNLQNTPTDHIVSMVERWDGAELPEGPKLTARSIRSDELRDRSHYMPVVELVGFVRLHRMPFMNKPTIQVLRDDLGLESTDPYELAEAVGRRTDAYLEARPQEVAELAGRLRALAAEAHDPLNLEMEGLRSKRAAARVNEDDEDRIDARLDDALNEAAHEHVAGLSDHEAAMCMLHLLIDADIYNREPDLIEAGPEVPSESAGAKQAGVLRDRSHERGLKGRPQRLPEGLSAYGALALSYLRSDLHVLLAGAPGTGKTTLAQFIGATWNQGLDVLPPSIDGGTMPLTTVANSGWSPFHTIGGLQPKADGTFVARPGIFIDPDTASETDWRLRDGAIVLDEMNRADLDRAIGELYPLLSRSVPTVYPAGIPGVERIHLTDRFRVIATVNDATLDDIVFPISEGLARRFQRIEMPGASEEDVLDFLQGSGVDPDRYTAVTELITALFSEASDPDLDLLRTIDEAERFDFGVGYFAIVQRWVKGKLHLPEIYQGQDLRDQGLLVLEASLMSFKRDNDLQQLMTRVRDSL